MKDDRLYLVHIGECIDRIQRYTSEGKESFFRDAKTQDAVLRNLQILSESTQHLSLQLKNDHPEVNWQKIAGFRNILVHDYLGINLLRVWEIVERDMLELKRTISEILTSLGLAESDKNLAHN